MPEAQPAPVGGPLPRGHLLALNRSFRRTLEAENKSSRTVEAYTDAVRFLALFCEAHGKPLLAGELRREHIQDFIADQLVRWKPATAHKPLPRPARLQVGRGRGDLQSSPMDGMRPPQLPEQIDRYTKATAVERGQSEPCPPVTRRPAIDLGHRPSGAPAMFQQDAEPRSAARQRRPRCGRCPGMKCNENASLPWNHREPLCGPPFPQVAPDRRGRSYRFSFGEVVRSPTS
jgi:hypothetical protein